MFYGLAFTTYIIWDGGYELTVRVQSHGAAIRTVTCEAFGHRREAEYVVTHQLPPESLTWAAVADPYQGDPIKVGLPLSGRDSFLGIELSRTQFRYLAVIATYADGRQVGQVVDIPDMRESREVTVTLP